MNITSLKLSREQKAIFDEFERLQKEGKNLAIHGDKLRSISREYHKEQCKKFKEFFNIA